MGAPTLAMDLDRERFQVTQEQLSRPGKDLADLSEVEFEEGLKRLKTVQQRIQKLLETALVEGGHYGNPDTYDGGKAFKKPILYKAGAEELRRLMRYSLRRLGPDVVTVLAPTPEDPQGYVSVVVEMGLYDATGRLLAVKSAACTTKEGRFRKYGKQGGWTYDDAREKLHDCLTMAEKRCGTLLTCEATGATAFLANGEEMESALEEAERPITPWTDAEKKAVYAKAAEKGIGRKAFAALVLKELGRAAVGTGPDVVNLLSAIARWTPGTGEADEEAGAGEASPAPRAAPAPGTKIPCDDCQGTGRNDADTDACATCTGTGRVRA